jgi:hypothetical protein
MVGPNTIANAPRIVVLQLAVAAFVSHFEKRMS